MSVFGTTDQGAPLSTVAELTVASFPRGTSLRDCESLLLFSLRSFPDAATCQAAAATISPKWPETPTELSLVVEREMILVSAYLLSN